MAFADFQEKQKQNKQKAVLRDFFVKRHGLLLVLSDDPIFVRLLRTTVKELALGNEASLVNLVLDPTKTLKAITDAFNDNRRPALFIERVMTSTGDTSLLIKQYKESFPELRIFVMTTTADKGRIMLMFEAGADNFILKPISGIDLVEKMSATLREPSLVQPPAMSSWATPCACPATANRPRWPMKELPSSMTTIWSRCRNLWIWPERRESRTCSSNT